MQWHYCQALQEGMGFSAIAQNGLFWYGRGKHMPAWRNRSTLWVPSMRAQIGSGGLHVHYSR